ncbi:MAG: hypothetical protein AAFY60_10695, partial [Myxococcota bacterium]
WQLVALATFTGIAWVTRIDAFYLGVTLLVGLFWAERNSTPWPLKSMLLALFAPLVATSAYFFAKGVGGAFLEKPFSVLRLAGQRANSELNYPTPTPSDLFVGGREGINAWAFYLGLVVLVLITIEFLKLAWSRRNLRQPDVLAAGVVVGWTAMHVPQWLLARPDTYHTMQQWFAIGLASVWWAHRRWPQGSADFSTRAIGRSLTLVGLVCASAIPVARISFGGQWNVGISQAQIQDASTVDGYWYPERLLLKISPYVELIEAACAPRDTLAAIPFQPGIAFLSRRSLATSDSYVLPVVTQDPSRSQQVMDDIVNNAPPLVIYGENMSANGKASGFLKEQLPALHALVEKRYSRLWSNGSLSVFYRPKHSPDAPPQNDHVPNQLYEALSEFEIQRSRTEILSGLMSSPRSPRYLSLLARLGFVTGDDEVFAAATDMAIREIQTARALYGDDTTLNVLEAANLMRLGLYERSRGARPRALKLFELAAKRAPRWTPARTEYARALAGNGRKGAAVEQLEQVLQLNPGDSTALRLRSMLNTPSK